jgi:hypothetical protein
MQLAQFESKALTVFAKERKNDFLISHSFGGASESVGSFDLIH